MSEKLQDLQVVRWTVARGPPKALEWHRDHQTRKYSITTDSNHTVNIAPYLLGQDFSTTGPRPEMGGRYVPYLG